MLLIVDLDRPIEQIDVAIDRAPQQPAAVTAADKGVDHAHAPDALDRKGHVGRIDLALAGATLVTALWSDRWRCRARRVHADGDAEGIGPRGDSIEDDTAGDRAAAAGADHEIRDRLGPDVDTDDANLRLLLELRRPPGAARSRSIASGVATIGIGVEAIGSGRQLQLERAILFDLPAAAKAGDKTGAAVSHHDVTAHR